MPRIPTQVFVTSDWHLGGSLDRIENDGSRRLGTSIFRSIDALIAFLRMVSERAASFEGITELVINGDIIDFLAPDPDDQYTPIAWQPDAKIVRDRLDQIVAKNVDSDGVGPFRMLRDLTAAGVRVTVMLGNHDVELSLPGVKPYFESLIAVDGNGVKFVTDNEAHTIGRMLIEHGNRYDPNNALDYSRLRQERSHRSRGLSVDEVADQSWLFAPPVGSRLVVDQINPRLQDTPFMNLLKPEVEAVVPLLITFFPQATTYFELMFQKFRVSYHTKGAGPDTNAGYLSIGKKQQYRTLRDFLDRTQGEDAELFRQLLPPASGVGSGLSPDSKIPLRERMRRLAIAARDQTCPWNLYDSAKQSVNKPLLKLMRKALLGLDDSDTFSIDKEESQYIHAASKMIESGNYDVVCFGHTHHPKDIAIGDGRYLNSGTWADVMRLPEAIRSDKPEVAETAMDQFFDDMRNHRHEHYTRRPLGYIVALVDEAGEVQAELKFFGN